MVRVYLLLLMLPITLIAGEFTATVNRKTVTFGESFQLILSLKDVSAKGSPAIAPLKKAFTIYSQQQSSNTTIVNGKMSSTVTWQVTLIPLSEGELTIPSISIETSEGTLASKPITLHVGRGNGRSGEEAQEKRLALTTAVSNATPYKGEPFTYTVKLIAREPIANVSMQKVSLSDAIVEQIENPSSEEKIVDGTKLIIVQFKFLITPLKSGEFKIPSTVVQGGIPSQKKSRFGSFFDDDFDPFHMMRGFNVLEPFALATDEIGVEVKPQVAGVVPWLPAKSVKIEDSWSESQRPQVGEPLTRTVTIQGVGVSSSLLPELSEEQVGNSSFKVYADTPVLKEEVKNGQIISRRTEQYTLIPEKEGTLELPEIRIVWWDVANQKAEHATLAPKKLEVLPADKVGKRELFPEQEVDQAKLPAVSPQSNMSQRDPVLYALIAILALLLTAVFLWGVTLQRKIGRLVVGEGNPEKKKALPLSSVEFKELDRIGSPQEIRTFLQAWGETHWHLSKNANVDTLFEELRRRNSEQKRSEIDVLKKMLKDALYNERVISLPEVKEQLKGLLLQTKEVRAAGKTGEILPDLNPT